MVTKLLLILGLVIVSSLGSFGFDSDSLISDEIKEYVVGIDYEINTSSVLSNEVYLFGGSGVIVDNSNDELTIFTNRHVVDCHFISSATNNYCKDIHFERGAVRTRDGKFHDISRVGLLKESSSVDIAILKVPVSNAEDYLSAEITDNFSLGEIVTAIGYPGYASKVVEFSVSSGKITKIKPEVYFKNKYKDWLSFVAIESDAYTSFGSSGGGLFNINGELIGINTWGDFRSGRSIAIQALTLSSFDESDFTFCDKDFYYFREGKCVPYDIMENLKEEKSFEDGVMGEIEEFASTKVSIAEKFGAVETVTEN